MVFQVAYLQKVGNGPMRLEERLVHDELKRRNVPVQFYSQKQIDRRSLPLNGQTFIMGDMPAMHGAMKQLRIPIPQPDDYPEALKPFLGRRVWRSTLHELERQVWSGLPAPIFAKPADRRKAFTGRVFASSDDLYFVGETSRRQEIWCSDVVEWRSEYRVYVVQDKIVAIDHYAGSESILPSRETLEAALVAYRESGRAPAAYGIDFGVLASGETALVEANDGYALGAYVVEGGPYTDLLMTRWAELLGMRVEEPPTAK